MMKRNGSAIGAVYLLCIRSLSLSASLPPSLTSMVHFNPPQFLAGGSAEQKAPFRAADRSFGLFSSSLSCCYITVNYEASSTVTPGTQIDVRVQA